MNRVIKQNLMMELYLKAQAADPRQGGVTGRQLEK